MTAMRADMIALIAAPIAPAGKPTTSAALPISEGSVMRKLRGVGRAASCMQFTQMVPCWTFGVVLTIQLKVHPTCPDDHEFQLIKL